MPSDFQELTLLVKSRFPILVMETDAERHIVELFERYILQESRSLFTWTITEGLKRIDLDLPAQAFVKEPGELLGHIRKTTKPSIYLLMDFHPYIEDSRLIRQLKEIAINVPKVPHLLVFISHEINLPDELASHAAWFRPSLPTLSQLRDIVHSTAVEWVQMNDGRRVQANKESLEQLVVNLRGLSVHDAERLARQAIYNDGIIDHEDVIRVTEAKCRLLDRSGALQIELDSSHLRDVVGLKKLKLWLEPRRGVFLGGSSTLPTPKGILLVGVPGCGKSLSAKAIAGTWGVPLLRFDIGSVYDKYFGASEANLRKTLSAVEAMSPCVLWIDEIEKAVATQSDSSGPSQRILGTLLTWMAEHKSSVFVVATANQIERLPPELIRKGRLDEIFFVDLPDVEERAELFSYHLTSRQIVLDADELQCLAEQSHGFSGAEIEQAIIGALYQSTEVRPVVSSRQLLEELRRTRPLSLVMSSHIEGLREWAKHRTTRAN